MTTAREKILADFNADLERTERSIIEALERTERNIIAAIERWESNRSRRQRNANRWMVGTIIAAIGVAVALTAAVEKIIS